MSNPARCPCAFSHASVFSFLPCLPSDVDFRLLACSTGPVRPSLTSGFALDHQHNLILSLNKNNSQHILRVFFGGVCPPPPAPILTFTSSKTASVGHCGAPLWWQKRRVGTSCVFFLSRIKALNAYRCNKVSSGPPDWLRACLSNTMASCWLSWCQTS